MVLTCLLIPAVEVRRWPTAHTTYTWLCDCGGTRIEYSARAAHRSALTHHALTQARRKMAA